MTREWVRPADNFWISNLSSVLEIEQVHRTAGFPAVDHDIVKQHYLQFLTFLKRNELTTAGFLEPAPPNPELRNHDLTSRGFAFVQKYHDRWIERIFKLRSPEAEERFLEKWLSTIPSP